MWEKAASVRLSGSRTEGLICSKTYSPIFASDVVAKEAMSELVDKSTQGGFVSSNKGMTDLVCIDMFHALDCLGVEKAESVRLCVSRTEQLICANTCYLHPKERMGA